MAMFNKSSSLSKLKKHETKREVVIKFILVVAITLTYFFFISLKFGVEKGFLVTLLTWSFFVFCTPIADAGLLFDFPMRLVLDIRMLHAEIFVWVFAFLLNLTMLLTNPSIYSSTTLLKAFHYIITHPIPYWLLIVLSAIGTFLSIHFADELMDVATHKERKSFFKHKNKYTIVLGLFIIIGIILLYSNLVNELGLNGVL